jgi:hypothetical protein
VRRTPLKASPPADHSHEEGYREWKTPTFGRCQGCGKPGLRERHHVVAEQHVRAEGGDPYDLRNGMQLGMHCRCHSRHTNAAQRLPLARVPDEAIAFASELFGAGAGAYLSRHYAP